MLLPGTQMHLVTFSITVFEIVILFVQILYYLERPSDKGRLWYLILLCFLILYNITGGLFPDDQLPISLTIQNILSYGSGAAMSMYFAFYFYKAFKLDRLRRIATYGAILYIAIPFLILFAVPYYIFGNLELFGKLVLIIPCFYAIMMGISIFKAFKHKYKTTTKKNQNNAYIESMVSVYVAFLFWLNLPVVTYFGGSQLLEHTLTNTGFLVMTISYIRTIIRNSKREFNTLQSSKQNLQKLNSELQEKVKERTSELEKLNEQKTNTFINLAHETKTPLTLMNNYLDEYILKHGITEELSVIKSNTDKLTRDIVNFFDLERLDKGFDFYEHEQITNFSASLQSTIILFRSLAYKKRIRIKEKIEDNIFIKSDPEAVFRIINNLIDNALKYTKENGEVAIKLISNADKIRFTVEDNGIGILPNMQESIFEPYFQIHSKKRNSDGMGMGLALVKKIVDGLGGNILLNSDLNVGTNFTIELQKYIPKNTEVASSISRLQRRLILADYNSVLDSVSTPDLPYILVVEDNLSLLGFLVTKLKAKYNVYAAENGAKALEKLESIEELDLVISDVMMDIIDGFELHEMLSTNQRYSHIPFIFLTAKTDKASKIDGLSLGAVDYIDKPFHINELLTKIDSILSNLEKQRLAIVNQAYKTILTKSKNTNEIFRTSEEVFDINCKRFGLTNKEKEITKLIIKGHPYKIISADLNIAKTTVDKHVSNIFRKTNVHNKVELINALEGL